MAKWLRRPTVNRKIPSSTLGGEVSFFFWLSFSRSFQALFFLPTFFLPFRVFYMFFFLLLRLCTWIGTVRRVGSLSSCPLEEDDHSYRGPSRGRNIVSLPPYSSFIHLELCCGLHVLVTFKGWEMCPLLDEMIFQVRTRTVALSRWMSGLMWFWLLSMLASSSRFPET